MTSIQHRLERLLLPGAIRASDSRIGDLVLLGSGFEADIYAFTQNREGDDTRCDLVLRLYDGHGAAEKSAREFATMSRRPR